MGFLNKILKKDEEVPEVKKASKVKVAKTETKQEEELLAPTATKNKKHEDSLAYRVIAKPLITEKATDLTALNKYVFVVPVTANKREVGERIYGVYGVKPLKINMIKRPGKRVRYGKRIGVTKEYKKAIVTLAKGQNIEVYEGV
jgi:large subunit ribosomal protein L23